MNLSSLVSVFALQQHALVTENVHSMVKDLSTEDHSVRNMARGHSVANALSMVRDLSMVVHSVHSTAKGLNMAAHSVHNMDRDNAHNMANMPDMDVHNMEDHHMESHKAVRRTDRPMTHRQNTL